MPRSTALKVGREPMDYGDERRINFGRDKGHSLTTTVWGIAGTPLVRLDLDQATRSDDMTVE